MLGELKSLPFREPIMIFVAILSLALALPAIVAKQTNCDKVSYKQLDVVFLLDGSGSVGQENFFTTLDFVDRVVNHLPISATETSVGVIQYTQKRIENGKAIYKEVVEVQLNSVHNKNQLAEKIRRIKYVSGSTYIRQAMDKAKEHFSQFGRRDVPKALIILTDGNMTDIPSLRSKADSLRSANINIITVGVGRIDNQALLAMAGDQSRVLSIDNFKQMIQFVGRLAMTLQKSIDPECYSNPIVTFDIEPKGPLKIGQNAKLTCKVESPLANIQANILRDETIVTENVARTKLQRGFRLTYTFKVTVQVLGVYQCQAKTDKGIVGTGPSIDVEEQVAAGEDGDDLEPSGSVNNPVVAQRGDFSEGQSAKQMCQRCINRRCTLRDGDHCTQEFLNCDNMSNPKGRDSCPPGHLFAVEDLVGKIKGNCWTARECRRWKLQHFP